MLQNKCHGLWSKIPLEIFYENWSRGSVCSWNWNICQFTSASNVISSSPPTRPFHWGLIKCMVDTPWRASPEETRTGELQLWPRGANEERSWKGRGRARRACVSNERQIFQNLSIRLPLSSSFFCIATCIAEQFFLLDARHYSSCRIGTPN